MMMKSDDNKQKNDIQEICNYLFFEDNGRFKTEFLPLMVYVGFCLLFGILNKIFHDFMRFKD